MVEGPADGSHGADNAVVAQNTDAELLGVLDLAPRLDLEANVRKIQPLYTYLGSYSHGRASAMMRMTSSRSSTERPIGPSVEMMPS